MRMQDLQSLGAQALPVFKEAGRKILDIRQRGFTSPDVVKDEDGYKSIQTEADLASDQIIVAGLSRLTPAIPVTTEENVYSHSEGLIKDEFWIVDPLDGTSHFRAGSDSFAVMGALISEGKPLLSVVYFPVQDQVFTAIKGGGAWRHDADARMPQRLQVQVPADPKKVRVQFEGQYFDHARVLDVVGRENILNQVELETVLSSGLYQTGARYDCMVAEGLIDLMPFLMDNCAAGEWDVAPPLLIVEEAGGYAAHMDSSDITFGAPHKKMNPYVMAASKDVFDQFHQCFFNRYDFVNRCFISKVATLRNT